MPSFRRHLVGTAAVLFAAGATAAARQAAPPAAAPPASPAATRAAGVKSPAPIPRPENPALTRPPTNHRDWTLVAEVKIHGEQPHNDDPYTIASTRKLIFDSATIIFPLLKDSASHEVWTDRLTGELRYDGGIIAKSPRLLEGYQAFARLGAWDARDARVNTLTLHIEIPMTCWETRIDEKRAAAQAWPKAWSPDLAACLLPQLLIESDSDTVVNLTKSWLRDAPGGPDPRNTPPYQLAKYLAGRVVQFYQPQAVILESSPRGSNRIAPSGALVQGYAAYGAAEAARQARGPILDMSNLLVAVWRAAGIPSRLVIGYDARTVDETEATTRVKSAIPIICAWAEFFLPDEKSGGGEWVPVQIARQRDFSSRPPPLTQRWQFFGHSEELDVVCPVSFHWMPPTVCSNLGAPALWGWVPVPETVTGDQELRMFVKAAARRGDDPKRGTPAPGGKSTQGK